MCADVTGTFGRAVLVQKRKAFTIRSLVSINKPLDMFDERYLHAISVEHF
jgi:hypothetical protein